MINPSPLQASTHHWTPPHHKLKITKLDLKLNQKSNKNISCIHEHSRVIVYNEFILQGEQGLSHNLLDQSFSFYPVTQFSFWKLTDSIRHQSFTMVSFLDHGGEEICVILCPFIYFRNQSHDTKKKKNTIQFKRDKNGKRHSIQAILKGLGLKIYYMNQVLELRKLVLIQFCEYKIKGRQRQRYTCPHLHSL